jgi:hypothetical protein
VLGGSVDQLKGNHGWIAIAQSEENIVSILLLDEVTHHRMVCRDY